MRAMLLEKAHTALRLAELPIPKPSKGELLIKVSACAVCRTDLHIMDGELSSPKLPLILGHQIVGEVVEKGEGVQRFNVGDRVGVPWLHSACQTCRFCLSGRENLCDHARYTGYQVNGGFAEYCLSEAAFTFAIPSAYTDIEAAPLLCGGLIGFRALRMTENAKRLGFYGFGASASLIAQVAVYQKREIYALTRKGDERTQQFALSLGAVWAGSSEQLPPKLLDAAIIFAPVGALVPAALSALDKGGIVVCAGIHMSDIPSFPYSLLWEERILRSVANLTRRDGEEFLALAPKIPIKTIVQTYPLEEANQALDDLRNGRLSGAAVMTL